MTETAHDRLATIAQNSDLGSGMAVAMKDLEIRGAGSILGAEQSGHIAGVGFDLYVRLVSEAVTAFKKQAGAASIDADGDDPTTRPPRSGSSCRSTPTCRTSTSRRTCCGWTPTARSPARRPSTTSPRCATSWSTASVRCRSQVEALLAVADLRRAAREAGITEIAAGPAGHPVLAGRTAGVGDDAGQPRLSRVEVLAPFVHPGDPHTRRLRPDRRAAAPRQPHPDLGTPRAGRPQATARPVTAHAVLPHMGDDSPVASVRVALAPPRVCQQRVE